MKDFDGVEEVLLSKDERFNAMIGQLQEKVEMERLTSFHTEEELRKREEQCQRAHEIYEMLLKEVKKSGLDNTAELRKKNCKLECNVCNLRKLKEEEKVDDSNAITEIKKKNEELECEVCKSKEKLVDDNNVISYLREKNGELECQVCELRKFKEKLVDDSNVIEDLRKKNGELEGEVCELKEKWVDDSDSLAELRSRVHELEEEVKKNLATIAELSNENRKLADEKESLNKKFGELQGRVVRSEPSADHGVTTFEVKEEEDVRDYELGNDTVKPDSLPRSEGTHHSLEAAGTAQPLNKRIKDVQGASSAGRDSH